MQWISAYFFLNIFIFYLENLLEVDQAICQENLHDQSHWLLHSTENGMNKKLASILVRHAWKIIPWLIWTGFQHWHSLVKESNNRPYAKTAAVLTLSVPVT